MSFNKSVEALYFAEALRSIDEAKKNIRSARASLEKSLSEDDELYHQGRSDSLVAAIDDWRLCLAISRPKKFRESKQ